MENKAYTHLTLLWDNVIVACVADCIGIHLGKMVRVRPPAEMHTIPKVSLDSVLILYIFPQFASQDS
jgi:hypothetical protein